MRGEPSSVARPALRRARQDDTSAIAAIWREGWREAHLGHIPDDLLAARLQESFAARTSGRVSDTVVAVTARGLAGFVMVVDDEVEQVYVSVGHRGTQVAGALLAEAERRVAVGGHQRAWLAVVAGNARARRFYARNGWQDEGRFEYHASTATGTIPVPCHRYVKHVVAHPSLGERARVDRSG